MSVMQARSWKEWLLGRKERCQLVNTANNAQGISVVSIVGMWS